MPGRRLSWCFLVGAVLCRGLKKDGVLRLVKRVSGIAKKRVSVMARVRGVGIGCAFWGVSPSKRNAVLSMRDGRSVGI